MADNVDALVAEIEATVDLTAAEALTRLNRAHRRFVSRARAFRKTVSIGPTVAAQSAYALPSGLVELWEVQVAGVTYGRALHTDIALDVQGWLLLDGLGGVIAPEESASGAREVSLIPAPVTGGDTVTVRGAFSPADLVAGGAASTILVDDDFYDDLVECAVAPVLRRLGEGDPDTLEAKTEARVEEFARRVRRRYRGPGPAQIRVQGINA